MLVCGDLRVGCCKLPGSSEESSAGAWARAGVGQKRAGETFPRGTCQAPFLPSPAGEAIPLRTRPTSARCWITALPACWPTQWQGQHKCLQCACVIEGVYTQRVRVCMCPACYLWRVWSRVYDVWTSGLSHRRGASVRYVGPSMQ